MAIHRDNDRALHQVRFMYPAAMLLLIQQSHHQDGSTSEKQHLDIQAPNYRLSVGPCFTAQRTTSAITKNYYLHARYPDTFKSIVWPHFHSSANPATAPKAAMMASFPALGATAALVVATEAVEDPEAAGDVAVMLSVTGSVAADVSKMSAVVTRVGADVIALPLPTSPRVVVPVPTAGVPVVVAVRKPDDGLPPE